MRLDLFVKLKYESSTIILCVGIRHSMHDLLSGLNNCLTRKLTICVSASSGISSPQQAVNSMSKRSLWWRFMKNFCLFPYFSHFWFSNMILSDAFILPVLQLQIQQVMTSQI